MIQKKQAEVEHPIRMMVYHDNEDKSEYKHGVLDEENVPSKDNKATDNPLVLEWLESPIIVSNKVDYTHLLMNDLIKSSNINYI